MNQPIGVIDSGVGGLSIVKALIKKLPSESFIYLADSKNCPYGEKSDQQIYKLSKKMINFLLEKKIKMLVIACNTITVVSINKLRKDYQNLPIVGIVPVIKTAVEKTKNKKIGIFSTKVTANSKYQKELINQFANNYQVLNVGSSTLVSLIENLDFNNLDKVLKKELEPFKNKKIDTLALGCSHFPLVKKEIQKILPYVLILDSADAVARQVNRILKHNKILSKSHKPSYNFYTTGEIETISYFVNKLTKGDNIERILLP